VIFLTFSANMSQLKMKGAEPRCRKTTRGLLCLCFVLMVLSKGSLYAQERDTAFPVRPVGDTEWAVKPAPYYINFPGYFVLLATGFKREFTAPFHMSKKDWLHVGEFAAVIGVVSLADEQVQRYAIRLGNTNPGIVKFGHSITDFGDRYEFYTLGTLFAYSTIFRNKKLQTTTLLASQAAIIGGVTGTVLKFLTWRQRPNYYGANIEGEPIFHGPFPGPDVEGNRMNSSFPSGHTTAAFAAATVYAVQYRNKPIVPVLMYTAAAMIGLTRITENKHWATDVLAGAALGYVTGKQVVRNYERYSRRKAQGKDRGQVRFSLDYKFGVVMPGLVYTFRN
jgi:hypothetical protein